MFWKWRDRHAQAEPVPESGKEIALRRFVLDQFPEGFHALHDLLVPEQMMIWDRDGRIVGEFSHKTSEDGNVVNFWARTSKFDSVARQREALRRYAEGVNQFRIACGRQPLEMDTLDLTKVGAR